MTEQDSYDYEVNDDDNFKTMLKKWKDIHYLKKILKQNEDKINKKLMSFLKEKNWDKYQDPETKISISLIQNFNEEFDKKQLKFMLTEAQYQSAVKIVKYEKMLITTEEDRQKLDKILK